MAKLKKLPLIAPVQKIVFVLNPFVAGEPQAFTGLQGGGKLLRIHVARSDMRDQTGFDSFSKAFEGRFNGGDWIKIMRQAEVDATHAQSLEAGGELLDDLSR